MTSEHRITHRTLQWSVAGVIAAAGLWLAFSGAYIQVKAQAAQQLLEWSWKNTQTGARRSKPWAWADTWPVARLRGPDMEHIVLSQASGRNLAFGPTHVPPSARPGQTGHVVISGHRDTHFRKIGRFKVGDLIILEHPQGQDFYHVTTTEILDLRVSQLVLQPERNLLTLVTCYPLDSVFAGTPLRYLVHLNRVDS